VYSREKNFIVDGPKMEAIASPIVEPVRSLGPISPVHATLGKNGYTGKKNM
jgi:hypothetical protein